MRFAVVSPNYPPCPFVCGVGDYTEKTAREFVENGHSVTVFVSAHYSGPSPAAGVEITPLYSQWGFKALLRLFMEARKRRFDFINVQYTPALYGFVFKIGLCLVNRFTPVIVSFHTLHRSTLLSKLETVMLIRFCGGFISTNEEITAMLKRTRVTRKEFKEIPIGPNILPAAPLKDAKTTLYELSPDTLVLSFFGLFYPGKGIETLVDACVLLKEKIKEFRLVFIGAVRDLDVGYVEQIKNRIQSSGMTPYVIFTGRLNDEKVSQHLQAADIFVSPFDGGASIRRGSLMAAIVHGLPIITTISETPSRYLNEQNMVFVQSRNSGALAAAILALARDDERRQALKRNALRLSESFEWNAISEALVAEFARLAAKGDA